MSSSSSASPNPAAGRQATFRRRRITVAVVLLSLVGVGILVLRPTSPPPPLGAGPVTGHRLPARAAAGTTTVPTSASKPAETNVIPAVGSTSLTVTDGTRVLTASVLYPAADPGVGVAALVRGRPWPLIVFSPGFDIAPEAYDGLLDQWVTAGFVVAVANYPGTAPDAPGGLNESDIVDHPADLRAVIDDTLSQSATPGTVLAGTTDPNRIGVAGHSDGGDVTDAVVSDSCCRDPRIRAAAVLSGAELASFGGSYGPPGVPLLVVQGDADQVNPPGCSQQIYDLAGSPRFYLDLLGSGHRAPYLASGPYEASPAQAAAYQQAVDRVSILFWHSYLSGDAEALAALHGVTGLGADAELNLGADQTVTGSCPGAPS